MGNIKTKALISKPNNQRNMMKQFAFAALAATAIAKGPRVKVTYGYSQWMAEKSTVEIFPGKLGPASISMKSSKKSGCSNWEYENSGEIYKSLDVEEVYCPKTEELKTLVFHAYNTKEEQEPEVVHLYRKCFEEMEHFAYEVRNLGD